MHKTGTYPSDPTANDTKPFTVLKTQEGSVDFEVSVDFYCSQEGWWLSSVDHLNISDIHLKISLDICEYIAFSLLS